MGNWSRDPLEGHPRYRSVKPLGEGTFGSVYHAKSVETGEDVAIKMIPLGDRFYPKYVEREILNHRQLIHPHIVAFKEVFVTPNHLAIVMEFVPGGNLQSWVEKHRRLPEWQARCFFQQLILALHYSHKSLGIAHRDIKLGNILLNDKYQVPILKLCDFGYSKDSWQGSLPKTRVGTAAYISPEVARANVSTVQYDSEKADVWSSAVTLYCMLAGRYPFTDNGRVPQLHQIKSLTDSDVEEALEILSDVSPGCKSLLRELLRVDPSKRMGLDGILDNAWYKQYLPDLSRMMSRKTEYLQTDENIRLVLSQAARRSTEIQSSYSQSGFDDEAAMQAADEVLQDLDFELDRSENSLDQSIGGEYDGGIFRREKQTTGALGEDDTLDPTITMTPARPSQT